MMLHTMTGGACLLREGERERVLGVFPIKERIGVELSRTSNGSVYSVYTAKSTSLSKSNS